MKRIIGFECQKMAHSLEFLIFVQRNKLDSAMCNLPIKKLKTTF